MNNLKNIGYMIFFVLYTAYEDLYRRTAWVLILFNASFILTQYFFSMYFELQLMDPDAMRSAQWFNYAPYQYDI
jgi:hypothetical protein